MGFLIYNHHSIIKTRTIHPNYMDTALRRLEICKQCQKRKFGENGLICSLTEAKPAFNGQCLDFETDQKAAQREIAAATYKQQQGKEEGGKNSYWWVIGVVLVIIRIIIRLARD